MSPRVLRKKTTKTTKMMMKKPLLLSLRIEMGKMAKMGIEMQQEQRQRQQRC